MNKWAGKFVIGLTGNIGTGKSVVRRMLEHLGAYGIDADTLSHRAIARGAPGYQAVVNAFGSYVVGQGGEVDRARLGRVVFGDPEAIKILESIVHPLVYQAVDLLARRSSQKVIVVEAIKLLESDLRQVCDSIWVTYTPAEHQVARLVKNRNMKEADARQRILVQPSQELKMAAAQIVIRNDGTFENTWKQVLSAWKNVVPAEAARVRQQPPTGAPKGELNVSRARPAHSSEIAHLLNRLHPDKPRLNRQDIMAAFGEKAFLLLQMGQANLGVLGWQVENLVARVTDMAIDSAVPVQDAIRCLVTEMERASRDLQCEIALVFANPELARHENTWKNLGYERRLTQNLAAAAWQEAAQESMQQDAVMYFKLLRTDRVLRPI